MRLLLGLNHEEDYQLFRLPDEASLDVLITDELAVATAYLTSRAGDNYTQTSDTNLQALMTRAEAYWVGMQLFESLKARKVTGSHWALDSEDSSRYEALIDTEWAAKFEMLTGPYISSDTTANPYSAGVFVTTTPVDPDDVDCITDQYDRILERSSGAWCPR